MDLINTKQTTKELLKNTGIIAVGQISTKIINFLLLPLYTTILAKEEYGLVDVLSTYTSIITVVVGLQINAAVFRFLVTCRNDEKKIREICSSSFFLEAGFCVLYLCLFTMIHSFLKIEGKWFLLAHVVAAIFLQFFSGVARGQGNNKLYACANFVSALVTLISNVFVIAVLRWGAEAMLCSYVLGPVVGGTILLFGSKSMLYIKRKYFSKEVLKDILCYAVPLVPNELSWSLLHSSDRMIVTSVLGVAENGLIAVASKFSNIYTMFFSVFNTSWTEQVVLHYKDDGGPEYICHMFDRMLALFGSFAIGIIACMPFIYYIFVPNNEYSEAYGLIPFYMMAVFFNAVIGLISAIYAVENETKKAAMTTAVAAAINIGVDVLLINEIGIYAAPVSSICGYIVISMWRLIDVNHRHCKIYMKKEKIFILLGMLSVALISYWSGNLFIKISALVVTFIGALVLNCTVLKVLIDTLKHRIRKN